MTLQDLETVLSWAKAEGWNPGLEDAAAFYAADPDGFFVKRLDNRPVAAISVVNHTDQFAFLGLYICQPEYRGKGYGLEVWKAGIRHANGRSIGLDGVPDQQANYAKSGFVKTGKNVRYRGVLQTSPQPAQPEHPDPSVLAKADARAEGFQRTAFLRHWFDTTKTRRTIVTSGGAFATCRQCADGIKIGPLQAHDTAQITELLQSIANLYPGETLTIDVPEKSTQLSTLLGSMDFEPSFETARMYLGAPPETDLPAYYAVACLELG